MYSFSSMKSECKPPFPRSPIRLRSHRPPLNPSNIPSLQTPPGSLAKYQKPTRPDVQESQLRPEYHTISCELRALSEMVREEFAKADARKKASVGASCSANSHAVFQRGRLYDEYSARRNERLKRKKEMVVDEGKPSHSIRLGVITESAKKYSSRKKWSIRKSVSAAYSVEVSETPRYMLRSMSKENRKPPLAAKLDKASVAGAKKVTTRRSGRI